MKKEFNKYFAPMRWTKPEKTIKQTVNVGDPIRVSGYCFTLPPFDRERHFEIDVSEDGWHNFDIKIQEYIEVTVPNKSYESDMKRYRKAEKEYKEWLKQKKELEEYEKLKAQESEKALYLELKKKYESEK
jgi:hypothetical protein